MEPGWPVSPCLAFPEPFILYSGGTARYGGRESLWRPPALPSPGRLEEACFCPPLPTAFPAPGQTTPPTPTYPGELWIPKPSKAPTGRSSPDSSPCEVAALAGAPGKQATGCLLPLSHSILLSCLHPPLPVLSYHSSSSQPGASSGSQARAPSSSSRHSRPRPTLLSPGACRIRGRRRDKPPR